jgi:hypothetical protein
MKPSAGSVTSTASAAVAAAAAQLCIPPASEWAEGCAAALLPAHPGDRQRLGIAGCRPARHWAGSFTTPDPESYFISPEANQRVPFHLQTLHAVADTKTNTLRRIGQH